MRTQNKRGSVDHPDMEVHTYHSLHRRVGYSPTGLADMYNRGKLEVITSRIEDSINLLVLSKAEIEKLIEERKKPYQPRYTPEQLDSFKKQARNLLKKGLLVKEVLTIMNISVHVWEKLKIKKPKPKPKK